MFISTPRVDRLHPSAAAVTDGDLFALHDDGHFALALGQGQHFIHFLGILFDVIIVMAGMRRTGVAGIGSAGLAVDHDAIGHLNLL